MVLSLKGRPACPIVASFPGQFSPCMWPGTNASPIVTRPFLPGDWGQETRSQTILLLCTINNYLHTWIGLQDILCTCNIHSTE